MTPVNISDPSLAGASRTGKLRINRTSELIDTVSLSLGWRFQPRLSPVIRRSVNDPPN